MKCVTSRKYPKLGNIWASSTLNYIAINANEFASFRLVFLLGSGDTYLYYLLYPLLHTLKSFLWNHSASQHLMKNWNFTANEASQSILSPGLIYLGYREQTPLQWEKRKKICNKSSYSYIMSQLRCQCTDLHFSKPEDCILASRWGPEQPSQVSHPDGSHAISSCKLELLLLFLSYFLPWFQPDSNRKREWEWGISLSHSFIWDKTASATLHLFCIMQYSVSAQQDRRLGP